MSIIKKIFGNHLISLAITIGISIILLAYFSKKILPEPLSYLEQAVPPFIGLIGEYIMGQEKETKLQKLWIWIVAVILSTSIIIYSGF